MEADLAPGEDASHRVPQLITRLEACRHKAHRHVDLVLDAIATGRLDREPALRPGTRHPAW